MEILDQKQVNDLLDLYSIEDTSDTFLKKVINKFPLSESEIRLIFQIIDRSFIRWFE